MPNKHKIDAGQSDLPAQDPASPFWSRQVGPWRLGGIDAGRVARQAGYGLWVETGRGAEPLEDDRHPSSWRSRSRSLQSTAAKPLQGREPRRRDAVIRTREAEPGFQQEI